MDEASDYSDEGFTSDALNDDDYELLYDLLPHLESSTLDYDVTADELKEILYYNEFDVSSAVREVEANFKKCMYKLFFYCSYSYSYSYVKITKACQQET